MGVEVFVPIGATEHSLTLTVIMRDFDPDTDSHPFADKVKCVEFVKLEQGSYFVFARTNKRHHHHQNEVYLTDD